MRTGIHMLVSITTVPVILSSSTILYHYWPISTASMLPSVTCSSLSVYTIILLILLSSFTHLLYVGYDCCVVVRVSLCVVLVSLSVVIDVVYVMLSIFVTYVYVMLSMFMFIFVMFECMLMSVYYLFG